MYKIGFALLLILFSQQSFAQSIESFTNTSPEKGFVAFSRSSSQYEGSATADATVSYFMVRPFEGSDFSLGASIYNSTMVDSNEVSQVSAQGGNETAVIVDNIQHTTYGTLLGYTWSSNGFLGLQAWGAVGYTSNLMSLESNKISVVTESPGQLFCQGSVSGTTDSVYTYPMLLGLGVTLNGFGFYVQSFRQNAKDIQGVQTITNHCAPISGSSSQSFTDTRGFQLVSSFSMVSTGIHYRF